MPASPMEYLVKYLAWWALELDSGATSAGLVVLIPGDSPALIRVNICPTWKYYLNRLRAGQLMERVRVLLIEIYPDASSAEFVVHMSNKRDAVIPLPLKISA